MQNRMIKSLTTLSEVRNGDRIILDENTTQQEKLPSYMHLVLFAGAKYTNRPLEELGTTSHQVHKLHADDTQSFASLVTIMLTGLKHRF